MQKSGRFGGASTSFAGVLSLPWLLGFLFLVFWENAVLAQADDSYPDYHLGPEDVLDVFVWKEVELTKSVIVRPDGGISFPLAGDMQVAGKTVRQVQEELAKRITPYIPEAVVTVSLSRIAGYRIYVIGKVLKSGQYVLGSYVNVAQAISIAQGPNPYAKTSDIKVIRRRHGQESVFKFDYDEFVAGKNLEQNISLENGDMVIVP